MRPNPRVVSKLPMKGECSRQGTALELTSSFQVMAQLIRDEGPEKAFEGGPKRTQEAQDEEGEEMKEIMIGRLVSQDSRDWLPWGQVLKSGPISCVMGGRQGVSLEPWLQAGCLSFHKAEATINQGWDNRAFPVMESVSESP